MGKKNTSKVDNLPPKDTDTFKEFSLCKDSQKKRTKEEGISFLMEQREQARLADDHLMMKRLDAILNNLTGGMKNGLRIEPDRIRKKSK